MESGDGDGRAAAYRVILLFGVVSLCGDLLYEGARSANGQYLELLGVSATVLGAVYGLGEFLGYALRLVSGLISDRTGRQWAFIFAGYGILVVVPLMGLTSSWEVAVALILLERIGKGLRSPPKDTILSQVAQTGGEGTGKAFGIQEALDQLGAFGGPLVFSLAFFVTGSEGVSEYQAGYLSLGLALVLLLAVLTLVRRRCLDIGIEETTAVRAKDPLTGTFWRFTAFAALSAFGLANFSIVGYYLVDDSVVPDGWVIVLYSVAMVVDAIVAIPIGELYDRMRERSGRKSGGMAVLAFVPVATAAIPPLVFSGSAAAAVAGLLVFGLVMGAHETVLKSTIADITPFHKRGTAYGVFYTAYGLAFFAGSTAMGALYDASGTSSIIVLSVIAEALAMAVFLTLERRVKKEGEAAVRTPTLRRPTTLLPEGIDLKGIAGGPSWPCPWPS